MRKGFVYLSEDEFVAESIILVDEAKKLGITLRILGALAVYISLKNKPEVLSVFRGLGRLGNNELLFTDLDLAAYGDQRGEITRLFKELGFEPDRVINTLFGHKRHVYYHPQSKYHVDVFFNKLEFSHDVVFGDKLGKGRLELDYPTITLADIILEKLQIHQINLKDIIDLIVMFIGHDIGENDKKGIINGRHIARVLADDWGFWYDAMTNSDKVKVCMNKYFVEGKLDKYTQSIAVSGIDKLSKMIEEEPKTKKWLKRAKVGDKKPWYREVEELMH